MDTPLLKKLQLLTDRVAQLEVQVEEGKKNTIRIAQLEQQLAAEKNGRFSWLDCPG